MLFLPQYSSCPNTLFLPQYTLPAPILFLPHLSASTTCFHAAFLSSFLRADVSTPCHSGADVSISRSTPENESIHRHFLKSFVSNNLHITHAFYTHPKILITALNGPAIGLSAAITAFSDFIYATPHTFLLTPFTSLGLVAEGGASRAFVQRLGISKANEALIMSKRLTIEELVHVGYVNKVFDAQPGDDEKFLEQVLAEVDERLGMHLNQESLVKVKALIRRPEREMMDAQGVHEVFGGLERFVRGIPQEEFRKIASGEKKHKL